ncbi:uncharacterized protein LOC110722128 [Chenopodium quinoa]|uniref:uncharacterized protein LOC110722128 n=1 Tax=Chenopodium quinoa TaxID=63459 RepID=UPI000B784C54|nr:uncharacterized protein LOC110722128 [Chenopodium quinoa]XP_021757073.1 uncharacterized protein LOC110722128 [Chenopodium quinoa]
MEAFKTRLRLEWMYPEDGVVRQQPPWKYPFIKDTDWEMFAKYCTSKEFQELSEKNRVRAKKKTLKYRGGRLGYQYFEEQIEKELEKQGVHVSQVPRHLTWIKADSQVKDGIIFFYNPVDREIHEAIIAVEAQAQRGEFVCNGRDDILARALNKREHGGSVRAFGSGITIKEYFGFNKPTAPSQLYAKIDMMQSEMGTMKNNQNLLLSFIMSCLNQEQLKSFMAIFGQSNAFGQFGSLGGLVGQFGNGGRQPASGGQSIFGGLVGQFGNGGSQPATGGQSSSGGQSGHGQQVGSSGQTSFGGQSGFGFDG